MAGNKFPRVKIALNDASGDKDVSDDLPLPVKVMSGGGGSGSDRELVIATYVVKTAFTGASIGDTITMTQIIDVSDTPTTVSTIWRNQTTAADLESAPSAANLEIVGSQALTDAQLRASAVPVADAALAALLPATLSNGNLKVSVQEISGASGNPAKILPVTLSLDTAQYAIGDVLADTQEVTGALVAASGYARLDSLIVYDEDDQGQALDIVILKSNVSLGSENGAPTITDANSREIRAIIPVESTDFKDLGGVKVAQATVNPALLEGNGADTSLWVAALSRGTGTYTANGLRLALGIVRL